MSFDPGADFNPYQSPNTSPPGSDEEDRRTFRPRTTSITDVLEECTSLYGRHFGTLIGAQFVLFLVLVFSVFVLVLLILLAMPAFFGNDRQAAGLMAAVLLGVLLAPWCAYLMLGLFYLHWKIGRGETPYVSDIFGGGRWLIRFIGALFVASILAFGTIFVFVMGGGLLALAVGELAVIFTVIMLFVPVVGFYMVYALLPFVIIDQDVDMITAVSRAFALVQANWLTLFGLGFIALMVSLPGTVLQIAADIMKQPVLNFVSAIYSLFTGPWLILMLAVAYLQMAGQPTASDRPSTSAGDRERFEFDPSKWS